ncbi:MAG: hypothetical protein RBT11_04935 [Desulfobacterales bacterium]|jgi:hypothetical protein|nr:hypothetical protein [Desulfobacterales bacterium]
MAISVSIDLSKSPELVSCFHLLVLKGVILTTAAGITVRRLLCDQIGIEPDYLENGIQTILLDGKAVDNLDETVVHDGAVLALSAAMPGLAGAVLRTKGILRGLRREISMDNPALNHEAGPANVTVKLFNRVLQDLGARLLCRGVTVTGKDLLNRLTGCRQELRDGGAVLLLEGQPADFEIIKSCLCTEQSVRLQIVTSG